MANNVITTSFTISFGSGGGGGAVLKAEVDDRPDGSNGGNTSFIPGDNVGWLLFKTTLGQQEVTITGMKSSIGSIEGGAASSKEIKETLTFANDTAATLGYPISGGFKSVEWVGANLGTLVMLDETAVKLQGVEKSNTNPFAGVVEVVYDSPCQVYSLTNTLVTGKSSYEALVVVVGTSPE